ncbi:TPA: ABC transporter ATP-binding protein [Streptococcus suis]|jgi:ABC-2 type transport system ATP-binding protein
MLKIENLSKRFSGNDFYSLKDVNLTINQGDIVGLIGKNGAGKSTLLKLIAKSLRPTDGSIEYFGHNIHQTKHILSNFGIMIEPVFFPEMTVMDNLKFYLDIHGKKEQYSNIEKTLRLVDLWEARNRKPKGFSFGMKQRTALAIALVSEPEFLLLDEPFVGLDPLGVNQLISILKQWSQERNISMIISSHQLGELEALCNRYVYIEGGRLETEMQIQSAPSVIIQLKDDLSEVQLPLELFESIQDGKIEVTIDSEADYLNQLMYTLSSQKAIKKIEIKENHLKDYFEMGD